MKAERPERNLEYGGPVGGVPGHRDIPAAIAVGVDVLESIELRVPARTIRMGPKDERTTITAEAVDQDSHVGIRRKLRRNCTWTPRGSHRVRKR